MKILFFGIKSADSDQIFLSKGESHHCVKVLRYKIGDEVQVLDGKGNLYSCIISDNSLNLSDYFVDYDGDDDGLGCPDGDCPSDISICDENLDGSFRCIGGIGNLKIVLTHNSREYFVGKDS